MPAPRRIIVPFNGHLIGQGFDSVTAERLGTALDFDPPVEDPQADAQSGSFTFQIVNTQEALEESLNIGSQLDVRYGLFSGGAKIDFSRRVAVNRSSTHIVAGSTITNALRQSSNFSLKENARELLTLAGENAFKNAFGDRFTQALHTGGEFFAVVRITSQETQFQQRLAATLRAELSGLTAGGSFKGTIESASSSLQARTEISIEMFQSGGQGSNLQIPGTEAASIRSHMNRFAAAVHEHAFAYSAELVSYDTIPLPVTTFEELRDRHDVPVQCQQRKRRYWTAISELDLATSEQGPLLFSNLPPESDLIATRLEFEALLNALLIHARAVGRGDIPPTLFVPESEPPIPRFQRRLSGSFAVFWAKRKEDEQSLLLDEKIIIDSIGREAAKHIDVPLADASPQLMERASRQITSLSLGDFPSIPGRELRSLESLPKILDAPLTSLVLHRSRVSDLSPLATFDRLEELFLIDSDVSDLGPLSAMPGLRRLSANKARINSLEGLRNSSAIQSLALGGNQIEDLSPLANLSLLDSVAIVQGDSAMFVDGQEVTPFVLRDNPISNARALAGLPKIASPFVSSDEIFFRLSQLRGVPPGEGLDTLSMITANRIDDTHRFNCTGTSGFGGLVSLMMVTNFTWPIFSVKPMKIVAVFFHETREVAVGVTHPDENQFFLSAPVVRDILGPPPDGSGFMFVVHVITGADPAFAMGSQ